MTEQEKIENRETEIQRYYDIVTDQLNFIQKEIERFDIIINDLKEQERKLVKNINWCQDEAIKKGVLHIL